MKVYEATVIDRAASRDGEEDVKFDSYVAVVAKEEAIQDNYELPKNYRDEDIHYYFTEDEWNENLQEDLTIETDEFTYWVGEQVA